jgi:hypothetical protein
MNANRSPYYVTSARWPTSLHQDRVVSPTGWPAPRGSRFVSCVSIRAVASIGLDVRLKISAFWDVAPCIMTETDVSEVLTALIQAVSISETSVNSYETTTCNIQEARLVVRS